MGWKSTESKTRSEAISLITGYLDKMSNKTLENILEEMGDDISNDYTPMHGHNFLVSGKIKCSHCGHEE